MRYLIQSKAVFLYLQASQFRVDQGPDVVRDTGESTLAEKDNNGGHLGHQHTPSQKDIYSLSTKRVNHTPKSPGRSKNTQILVKPLYYNENIFF